MVLEGKVSGQPLRTYDRVYCAKCKTELVTPNRKAFEICKGIFQIIRSYMHSPYFIYESKSGFSIIYCSKYCRNKHNHRFHGASK